MFLKLCDRWVRRYACCYKSLRSERQNFVYALVRLLDYIRAGDLFTDTVDDESQVIP